MSDRVQTKDLVKLLAKRMKTDEETAGVWLDAMLDTLYKAFKKGQSVTLTGFGGFYVRRERGSWVFTFSPSQKLRKLFRWSSTYKGKL